MVNKRKFIVGVMGPGNECPDHIANAAKELGGLIAKEGWVVLSGGRDLGVMEAVSAGAKEAGGTTIGILPTQNSSISEYIDYAIITDVAFARNNINVVTSDVVVSCGIGVGTSSEIALALNAKKTVIMLHSGDDAFKFFKGLREDLVFQAGNPDEAITLIKKHALGSKH